MDDTDSRTVAVSLARERPRGICRRASPQWTMLRNEVIDHRLDRYSTHMNRVSNAIRLDEAICGSPHSVSLDPVPGLPM